MSAESVREPPRTLGGVLRQVGPGLVMAAAVVGSGELVLTTVLGAEVGVILLWLVLLSCAVKVVVQHELGRYTIASGETTLEALDHIPGPRFRVGWVNWLWLVMVASLMFSIGGMLGAIAEVLSLLAPALPSLLWVPALSLVTLSLLYTRSYPLVEKTSFVLVGMLTLLTVLGALLLLRRPDLLSLETLAEGLRFRLPEDGLATAITVFGATGVGAAELASYPYWCLEKGYAKFVGEADGSANWLARAQGWTRVMSVDVTLSLFVYTFGTIAFYLLGGAVLHAAGIVPSGADTVRSLSRMYAEMLGEWSLPLFFAGAIAVLYSTVFVLTDAYSRLTADFLGLIGFFEKDDRASRARHQRYTLAAFLILPCFTFYFVSEPVLMVKVSGATQAVLLPILGFSTLFLRYRHLPAGIAPSKATTAALWATSALMFVAMAGAMYLLFGR